LEIPAIIKKRKSIRAFTEEAMWDEAIEKLIEAAVLAPSAGNMQPWAFITVKNKDTLNRLSEAAKQAWMVSASVVIVVCTDAAKTQPRYGERGTSLYMYQDTAAAIQNILLTAVHNGFGGTWMGAFDEAAVSAILNLPSGIRPVAMIPIGHPSQDPTPRPRRPVAEVLHKEKW
jgi:nitroreductase